MQSGNIPVNKLLKNKYQGRSTMHRLACVLFLTWGIMNFASANEHLRDYYQEPGLNPFKEDAGTASFESIDPFSGALQLQHADISLPGNGGMDMTVTRFYNNPQGSWDIHAYGVGWTMHPGRLVISNTYAGSICNQINGTLPLNTSVTDNPSYELPDGSRKVFFRDMTRGNTQYISRDNWRLQCGGTSGMT